MAMEFPFELLSRSRLWATLAVLAGTYLTVSPVLSWYRLRHINGPWFAAWSNLWLLRRTSKSQLFEELGEACDKYGPVVRVAPNHVILGDPLEIRRIWGVRSQFDRSIWYQGFRLDPPRDSTLTLTDADLHTALRAKLSPGYGGKDVDGLHESVDEGVARFIQLIEEKYLSTETAYRPVDFARKVQYMTLDIISKIAFGESFGFMDEDGDLFSYVKTTEESVPMMQMFALIPSLISILQSPLCKALVPSETDAVGLGPIMARAKKVVAERFGPDPVERRDMLGSFVKHGATQKEAEAESLVQIIAGSDTTASALRSIIAHVVTNPVVYRRLQAEIDAGSADGRVSSPITDAEARQLPFLQACIKEGFRIWPPITGIMPRVSDTDALVSGVKIPAGTQVGWSARTALRDRGVFGVDAEMYRPDRWLLADADQLQVMANTVDLCFGQGRWGCLGRPIALIELNKMIVELLRRFDFAIIDVERPVKNAFTGVLLQSELNMRISRR